MIDTSTEVIEVQVNTENEEVGVVDKSVSSVFISPGKGKKKEKDRFVKI